MLSQPTREYGARAAAGLLGVDALYRKEDAGGDGLVVVNMARPGEIATEAFSSYDAARRCFEALDRESAGLPEEDRRTYYRQLCRSTLAFIQWRQTGLPFEDQLSGFLHVPVEPAPQAELDALCEEIRGLLGGMGYHGDLQTQCAGWEERNRVPPDEVEGVMDDLMGEAWERTEERLLEIPAQKDDGMQVVTVSGEAFNARCDYLNRTIELNTDPTLTRPGLKHLAAHEGYPGHYVQFKLRETEFRRGATSADVLLSVVNTASSSVFEGIADAGMEMMDWVTNDDDRVLGLINRHRAGVGTGAAWRLHALGWSGNEVENWLRDQSLVGGDGWVSNRMAFISAPSRAVLIWSYWWGERVVTPTWRRLPSGRRQDFLSYLFGRMHSNQTVERFA